MCVHVLRERIGQHPGSTVTKIKVFRACFESITKAMVEDVIRMAVFS